MVGGGGGAGRGRGDILSYDKEDGKVEVNSKIPHQAAPEVSQALSFGPG